MSYVSLNSAEREYINNLIGNDTNCLASFVDLKDLLFEMVNLLEELNSSKSVSNSKLSYLESIMIMNKKEEIYLYITELMTLVNLTDDEREKIEGILNNYKFNIIQMKKLLRKIK